MLAQKRADFGQHLEDRYTMHEERAIHQQQRLPGQTGAGHTPDNKTSQIKAPTLPEDVDLWGDAAEEDGQSIELFEQESNAAAEEVELWGASNSGDGGCNVEAADKKKVAEKHEVKDSEEFGENVELF